MIHIIQQFANAFAGSEQEAIQLYTVLSRRSRCRIWTEFPPDPRLQLPELRRIQPRRFQYPLGGTMIFVGACWYVGRWLTASLPRRIIVIHNYPHDSYKNWFQRIRPWHPSIEWVFVSEALRIDTKLDGPVSISPIDTRVFSPKKQDGSALVDRQFVVGRLSRDVPEKFHKSDPELFLRLAERGFRVRIMGGNCIRSALPTHSNIEILEAGAEPAADFLRTLDALVYRTSDDWFEAFGRVIFEAMACGIPVICGSRGGYAEQLTHGKNSILFERSIDAVDACELLRRDPSKRNEFVTQGQTLIEEKFGDGLPREMIEFYLR